MRTIRLSVLICAISAAIALPAASADAATTATPTSLDFGNVPVGQQATLPVTLTETCTSVTCTGLPFIPDIFAPVLSITSTDFTQTSNCPLNLLAMLGVPQSCTIDVSFIPVVGGPISGLLSTGSGGPAVPLTGTGVAPSNQGKRKNCKKKKHRAASAKKKCKKKRR